MDCEKEKTSCVGPKQKDVDLCFYWEFLMDCEEKKLGSGRKEAMTLAMAAAKALTIKQLRMNNHATMEYAAHVHVRVEQWKERYGIAPREKRNVARKFMMDRCKELGGELKCMRC